MNKPIVVIVGLLVVVLLVLFSTTYTLKYNEVAIKQTFGQTDEGSIVTEPGLHYRLPVFNKVTPLDTRLQLIESPLEEIATSDDLQIIVRAFMLWRVDTEATGPLDFFRGYGSIEAANNSLQAQFRTAFTGALSGYRFDELIGPGSRLASAETAIRDRLAASLATTGVQPVQVGIEKIVLPPRTSTAVLGRMQAMRDLISEGERVAGQNEAQSIRDKARTQADALASIAGKLGDLMRAEAEQVAAEYMKEQAQAEDLAIFLVWLDTFKRALSQRTTAVLPMRVAPFHFADPGSVERINGIPYPAGTVAPATSAGSDSSDDTEASGAAE